MCKLPFTNKGLSGQSVIYLQLYFAIQPRNINVVKIQYIGQGRGGGYQNLDG